MVLEYDSPLATDTTAERVFGQLDDFTAGATDNGGIGPASLDFPEGVAVDLAGNLYVLDSNNNRLLEFDTPVPNPAPTLTTLDPDMARLGGGAFTLSAIGSDFVPGATIHWDGAPRTTTFVSDGELTAAIGAADLATAGTVAVTVVNPGPGGGASNALDFTVDATPVSCPSFFPIGQAALVITRLGTPAGARVRFQGTMAFPLGTPAVLDPATTGAQVAVIGLGPGAAALFDLSIASHAIPPGGPGTGCDAKDGWTRPKRPLYGNRSGRLDPPACTSGSAQGLRALSLRDRRPRSRGILLALRTKGTPHGATAGPLGVRFALGASEAALEEGLCAEVAFTADECRQKRRTLRCRRP